MDTETQIKKLSDTEYEVDGLLVYQNSDGEWNGHPEMDPYQVRDFQKHLNKEKREASLLK